MPHQLRISTGLLIPDSAIELNATEGEDCLSLNVYAPPTPGRRPVLMYIHGGNFVEGAGSQAWTEPSEAGTARRRRGCNDQLSTGGRSAGCSSMSSAAGSLGPTATSACKIRSRRCAGSLVTSAPFGGDPGNVTASGYSAGCVEHLRAAGRRACTRSVSEGHRHERRRALPLA